MSFTKGKNVAVELIFKTFILKTSNRKEVENLEGNTSHTDITNCQSDGLFGAYDRSSAGLEEVKIKQRHVLFHEIERFS